MGLLGYLPQVITVIFLGVVLSYYALVFLPLKRPKKDRSFSSLTVVVPAHNEEEYIAEALDAVLAARFDGKKQVIVVDDGSIDGTASIVREYRSRGVVFVRQKHAGKSASLNRALAMADGDL